MADSGHEQALPKNSEAVQPKTDVFIPNPDALAARLLAYLEDDEDDMDDEDQNDEDGGMGGFGESSSNQFPLMSTISRYTDTSRILTVDLSAAFPAFNIPIGDTKKALQGNVQRGDMSARAVESARRHEAQDAMIRDAHGGEMHVLDLGGRVGQEAACQASQPAAKQSASEQQPASVPTLEDSAGQGEQTAPAHAPAPEGKMVSQTAPNALLGSAHDLDSKTTVTSKLCVGTAKASCQETICNGTGSSESASMAAGSTLPAGEGFAASTDAVPSSAEPADSKPSKAAPLHSDKYVRSGSTEQTAAAAATVPQIEAVQLGATPDRPLAPDADFQTTHRRTKHDEETLVHTGTSPLSSDSPRIPSNRELTADGTLVVASRSGSQADATHTGRVKSTSGASGTGSQSPVTPEQADNGIMARTQDAEAASATTTTSPGPQSTRIQPAAPLTDPKPQALTAKSASSSAAAAAAASSAAAAAAASTPATTTTTTDARGKGFLARLLSIFGCTPGNATSSRYEAPQDAGEGVLKASLTESHVSRAHAPANASGRPSSEGSAADTTGASTAAPVPAEEAAVTLGSRAAVVIGASSAGKIAVMEQGGTGAHHGSGGGARVGSVGRDMIDDSGANSGI